ncbi:hypothetical protein [Moritella viscosa]|uniref:Bifunctional pantoate ligase/cytidylate kinase-Pantothenate synthetase-Pantoate--beta-alanine ligase-Pantoate-activating enzyme-Cytidylate kinase-Cytidine monophosphate kinase n=1 Tax=Moritella viscosa TaxID=80854 RepID=A0ABY1HE94_9GAMM|nr:hypothetical protein [Moritella viscosa]SGY93907.1 Bifunctional pantoate ligase/cytidylate kinase-Pantothenate synthetase-Pantoate--beta-alanine ligase-Pantoate-activating enzyme-Cytidylate kinase-Cytidine monophosphate kinase [Moritella viscosa]SGZ05345.1 Bifunctional pantoate ligase/cytidylate kinase-Pantothenate synthetase-Pantoate--beta-alanine ligase-Pantoate-activating enzyme-Cytidylate kinase-Cytidine monophosphate kinase [Moritella viscosa]SHO26743.1 Bifunctional pantoate ligase/cytid
MNEELLLQELKGKIQGHYDGIMQVAARVLSSCRMFDNDLGILKLEDPSFAQLASKLLAASGIIDGIVNSDVCNAEDMLTAQKAREYALAVKSIADNIAQENKKGLEQSIEQLNTRSFL